MLVLLACLVLTVDCCQVNNRFYNPLSLESLADYLLAMPPKQQFLLTLSFSSLALLFGGAALFSLNNRKVSPEINFLRQNFYGHQEWHRQHSEREQKLARYNLEVEQLQQQVNFLKTIVAPLQEEYQQRYFNRSSTLISTDNRYTISEAWNLYKNIGEEMDRFGLRDWLYRLANEMTDGPDAHLADKVKAFADEHGKADEAPTPEVNLVPPTVVSTPTTLAPATPPSPPSNDLSPDDIAKLKELLGKLQPRDYDPISGGSA